jgi:predicted nucleic acid-binding protein
VAAGHRICELPYRAIRAGLRPADRLSAGPDTRHAIVELHEVQSRAVTREPVADPVSPDSGDDYLIALARDARADAIVSCDSHLTQLVYPTPPVLTPRQFIEELT